MKEFSILVLIITTIRMATPLMLASVGGVFSEKAGVSNIGIEGMMVAGAFMGMAGSYYTGNPWFGVLAAMGIGAVMATIHGFVSITCGGNQSVSSTGLILLGTGLSAFGLRSIFGRAGNSDPVNALTSTEIFRDIPVVGETLADFSPFLYIAIVLIAIVYYILYHTPLGLRIKTVGENPKVAETVGINVWGIRYFAVITSGVFAGLAGAYLSLGQMNMFQEGMTAGRGFLALGAVIMGRWTPYGAVLASLFFGLFEALQLQLQMMPNVAIPYELLQSMPYIASLIVLATSVGKSRGPAANGVPYLKRS